ncbi:hypothetical protein PWJ85_09075, partial [Actinotignum schaalii]|uniref:hypothetical protein n=1 Tax=Actinotignum schaalii TaxID=59505 RepID=UPI0026591077
LSSGSCFTVVILVYLLGGFHPHTQTIRHSRGEDKLMPDGSINSLYASTLLAGKGLIWDVKTIKITVVPQLVMPKTGGVGVTPALAVIAFASCIALAGWCARSSYRYRN